MNANPITDFHTARVSKITREKAVKREQKDKIQGLLETLEEYAELALAMTPASIYKEKQSSCHGSQKVKILVTEVVHMLGNVNGLPHYFLDGLLYRPTSKTSVYVPTLEGVPRSEISQEMVQEILRIVEGVVQTGKEPEVHACGFFIFRYFIKVNGEKKRRFAPVGAHSLDAAIIGFRVRDEWQYDIERAWDIQVYYSKWMRVEKMPPAGDIHSLLGRPVSSLHVVDEPVAL